MTSRKKSSAKKVTSKKATVKKATTKKAAAKKATTKNVANKKSPLNGWSDSNQAFQEEEPRPGFISPARRKADDIYEEAMEVELDEDLEEELLHQVLEVDPTHELAMISLAQIAQTPEESLDWVQRAISCLVDRLGSPEMWPDDMWNDWNGRTYLKAKVFISEIYEELGNAFEAANALHEVVALDPDDVTRNLLPLVIFLALQRRWEELESVLACCDWRHSIEISYVQALTTFHREGDTANAQNDLKLAIETGPQAVKYLLGETRIEPSQRPALPGASSTENAEFAAEDFCRDIVAAWRGTPGALTWLKGHALALLPKEKEPAHNSKDARRRAKAGFPELLSEIRRFPQAFDETWLVDVRDLDADEGWGMMIADVAEGLPIGIVTFKGPPCVEEIAVGLMGVMESPYEGGSRRPGRLELTDAELLGPLSKLLSPVDIEVEMSDRADELNQSFDRSSEPIPNIPLTEVEQASEVTWAMDWGQLGMWTPDERGAPIQPWTTTILDLDSEMILISKMTEDLPTLDDLREAVREAILRPMMGTIGRPGTIRVRSADNRIVIADWLKTVEIDIEVGNMDEFDEVLVELSARLMGDQLPGAMEIEGVSLQLVEQFYETSVRFYKAGLWAKVRSDVIIQLACPALTSHVWFALIVGQLGTGLGLMLFDNPDFIQSITTERDPEDDDQPVFTGINFTLDDKFSVSPADAAAADQFGWPVAAPEAWPIAVRIDETGGPQALDVDDLRWLVACIESIPKFFNQTEPAASMPVLVEDQNVHVSVELYVGHKGA